MATPPAIVVNGSLADIQGAMRMDAIAADSLAMAFAADRAAKIIAATMPLTPGVHAGSGAVRGQPVDPLALPVGSPDFAHLMAKKRGSARAS